MCLILVLTIALDRKREIACLKQVSKTSFLPNKFSEEHLTSILNVAI